MSQLSEYLNAHIPDGWSKARVVEALEGKVDRTTVYRYLAGQHPLRPSEATLEGFAALPGVSLPELHRLVGEAVGEDEPWVPTKEANRLNRGQRQALDAFIRATVNARSEAEAERPESVDDEAAEPPTLGPAASAELRSYLSSLHESGRGELANLIAASLPIKPPATRSSDT